MSTQTAKYAIPYAQNSDPVANLPTIMANMANRVDLLLGETGTVSVPIATANTTVDTTVSLTRSYPNGARVMLTFTTPPAAYSPGVAIVWVISDVAAAGSSFHFGVQATNTTTRTVEYHVIPNP